MNKSEEVKLKKENNFLKALFEKSQRDLHTKSQEMQNLATKLVELSGEQPTKDEKVWLDVWIAVSGSNNIVKSETATHWADQCLSAFKERFDENTGS